MHLFTEKDSDFVKNIERKACHNKINKHPNNTYTIAPTEAV